MCGSNIQESIRGAVPEVEESTFLLIHLCLLLSLTQGIAHCWLKRAEILTGAFGDTVRPLWSIGSRLWQSQCPSEFTRQLS